MTDVVEYVISYLRAHQTERGFARIDLGADVWSRIRAVRITKELQAAGTATRVTNTTHGADDEITIHTDTTGFLVTWWRDDLAPNQQETYRALRADGTSPRKAKQLAEALEERA